MRSLGDVKNWLSLDKFGSCETSASQYWRLLASYAPDIRVVTIRRPVDEVVHSLKRLGMDNIPAIRAGLIQMDRKLDQLEKRLPSVRSYQFSSLSERDTCRDIFEYCIPNHPFDAQRWERMDKENVQINFPAMCRYVKGNLESINKLAAQAAQQMRVDIAGKKKIETGPISIEEESCVAWKRDCQHLFRQHCTIVDEHPEQWANKNWPLFAKLNELGFMQIMIARSNGKAFGYLMTLLSPSLEKTDEMIAQHTTHYADKSFPGLGLKLQRAAMTRLKEKNVKETYMRAGVRGDGDRMPSLYKRLGAEEFGTIFRIGLGE
jgi:ribosomal protein S18 acetylase RimI-like enzyme